MTRVMLVLINTSYVIVKLWQILGLQRPDQFELYKLAPLVIGLHGQSQVEVVTPHRIARNIYLYQPLLGPVLPELGMRT